jgi:hypothetical protein
MIHYSRLPVILMVLTLVASVPVYADSTANENSTDITVSEETPGIEAEEQTSSSSDKEKADKERKAKDPNRGRFLPIPIFITEPAIGDGLGMALAYFHRTKNKPEGRLLASPNSISEVRKEHAPPPTVTGIFGAYTSNKTAAAGIGHMNSFKDDHIRFTAVAALADINSTFYVADQPFKFNLEGVLVYQETRFRFGDSRWFWGIGLSYLDASSAFQVELPEDPPVDFFRSDVRNVGLSAKLSWDTRDSTSMPNTGQLFDFAAWRYDDIFSGDFDYWDARLKFLSFHQLHEKFVLGWRFEYSSISGRAPFFAVPYVKLRGIAALRYQGDRVAVAEIEGRYNFSPKWALIGFVGKGAVSSNLDIIDTDQNIRSFGLGGRYKIFDAQNIWIGIDIAKGPEDYNWYIQIGQAW